MLSKYFPLSFVFSVLFLSQVFADVDTPDVRLVPDSTNTYSEYTIISAVSNAAVRRIQANVDSIFVRFNSSTTVPSSIDPSYVSINNTSANIVTVDGQILSNI